MALDTLVTTAPAVTDGIATQLVSGAGVWRFAVQIADPAAASPVWHDVTCYTAGYRHERGSGEYGGRWTASVTDIDLVTDDDRLAPWNDDTSGEFGVHVDLGAGLLMRAVLFRVDTGTVAEWHPRFTHRVEVWGDGTQAEGRLRRHQIVTRDLMSSLVNAPVPAFSLFSSWHTRIDRILSWAEWPFGVIYYGATGTGVILITPTPASLSAVTLIDAVTDPSGIVWGTDRYGRLVFRPMLGDQFHADALTGGADGTAYPTETPVDFSYDACNGPELAYALTQTPQPFGIDDTELNIVNQVRVTDLVDPEVPYYVDNPVSGNRFGAHPLNFSWLVPNDAVADQIVEFRAFASKQARPLVTTVDLDNFFPLALDLEWMTPVDIEHLTAPGRDTYTASGWVRSLVERGRPRNDTFAWDITAIVDIDGGSGSSSASLLPVTGLAASNITENDVDFDWTNPGGQPVTPTHVQVRLSTSVVWTELDYPAVAYEWHGLTAGSDYEFSVRLIRRVDDQIVAVSPIRRVAFTTDTTTGPIITPNPDPDGPPVVVTPPPYDPDCDLDWKLESSTDGSTWSEEDSGTLTGGETEIVLDGALFLPGYVYQVCTREDCGTPGPWYCTDVFPPACVDNDYVTSTDFPFSDSSLVAYWPEVCPPDLVRNAVSGYLANHGPAWGGLFVTPDERIALETPSSVGGVIIDGDDPAVLFYGSASIGIKASVQTQETETLIRVPGLRIDAVPSGSGWTAEATAVTFQSGTEATVTSAELPLITPIDVIARYDETTGTLDLSVAGVVIGSDTAENDGDRAHTSGFYVGAPSASWVTDAAVWDTVVESVITESLPMYSGGVTGTLVEGLLPETPTVGDLLIAVWHRNGSGSGTAENGYTTVQTGYLPGTTAPADAGRFLVHAKIATGTNDEPSVDGSTSEFWQYTSAILADVSSFTTPADLNDPTIVYGPSNPLGITVPAAGGGTRWLDIVQIRHSSGTVGDLSVTASNGVVRGFVQGTDDVSVAIVERFSFAANTITAEFSEPAASITHLYGFVLEVT